MQITGLPAAYSIDLGYQIAIMTITQRVLQVSREKQAAVRTASDVRRHKDTVTGSLLGNDSHPEYSESTALHEVKERATSAALKVLQSYLRTASVSGQRLPEFYIISVEFAILLIARAHVSPIHASEQAEAVETLSRLLETCTSGRLLQVRHVISRAIAVVKGEVASATRSSEQLSQNIQEVVAQEAVQDCDSSATTTLADQLDWSAWTVPAIIYDSLEMQEFFTRGY